MEKIRPTIIDVARQAGVSKSTVSYAMRNSPLITNATKKKIQSIARKMGYLPSMVYSIMGSGNRMKGTRSNLLPLAYLHDNPSETESNKYYFKLLAESALSYGYYLDPYDISKFDSARKIEKVLFQCGYCGVIIGRVMSDKSLAYELDLSKFIVVFYSNTLWNSKYHRVSDDVFNAVQIAWDRTVEAGYRRIGVTPCCHSPSVPDDELRLAAVLQRQKRDVETVEEIPPFTGNPGDMTSFKAWIKKWRPDAVIGFQSQHYYCLKDMGFKIPRNIGYAGLFVYPQDKWSNFISGILDQERRVAETSISVIDQEIRKRTIGIPEQVLTVLLEPQWSEGKTLLKGNVRK